MSIRTPGEKELEDREWKIFLEKFRFELGCLGLMVLFGGGGILVAYLYLNS